MKARRLLALSILAIAFACEGNKLPTAVRAPTKTWSILSDGAHGGNHDFFFLPPLVPPPYTNPDFEPGKSNNTLKASLVVEICELKPEIAKGKPERDGESKRGESSDQDGNGKLLPPTASTPCIPNPPKKKFGVGSVQLVEHPSTETGWWTASQMPADGFYYALWDTRKIDLNDNKYYRIKVFIVGATDPLGYADVQSIDNQRKWRNIQTGGVIPIVDDVLLPIPFRVEQGALCGGAASCTSTTVTNFSPDGFQTVTVDGGLNEAVAGAKFPNGWLPDGGPQSVVVTISQVNTGTANQEAGTQEFPCHANLPFEQFDGCYLFTTTPTLAFIGNTRAQFAQSVTVAVCYVLEGTTDPRRNFAQMYASGPNEPAHALTDVDDAGILSPLVRNCTGTVLLGSTAPATNLASAGWRRLIAGVGQLFSVKTAYAVDVGLGGLIDGFSNVGAALPATIEAYPNPEGTTHLLPLVSGVATASAKIVGNHQHSGAGAFSGINNVPVTFTVAPNNGYLGFGEGAAFQVPVNTATLVLNPGEGQTLVDGIASVEWRPPTAAGEYTMTAAGPATGGPITFHVVVPPPWTGTASVAATAPVLFGGPPYCYYTVQLSNIQASLQLNTAGGGSGTVTATNTEALATPPCGNIQPAPPHFDTYASNGVSRIGNNVIANFSPVGNPISAGLQFVGTMSSDQQTLSGTFSWQRIDQGPPLNWTIVTAVTFGKTP